MKTSGHRIRCSGGVIPRALAVLSLGLAAGCAAPSALRQIIRTAGAPAAIGPYSQAILRQGVLYVSGQIALDPATGRMAPGGIREQTARVMDNLGAVLAAAQLGFDDVVLAQVFLADLNDYGAMNEVYAARFTAPPARVTVQVARLPRDAKIEIAVIASRSGPP